MLRILKLQNGERVGWVHDSCRKWPIFSTVSSVDFMSKVLDFVFVLLPPDQTFSNFRALESVDRRFKRSFEASIAAFGGSYNAIILVGLVYDARTWELWNPGRPFRNFGAPRSGDRRTLCDSEMSYDGFWSSQVVKGSVGTCGKYTVKYTGVKKREALCLELNKKFGVFWPFDRMSKDRKYL